jgi:anti-sigma B factor antagonist
MEIPIERSQSITIAEIPVNELDASNAGDLKSAMAQILDHSSNVILDVKRMQFIDSSGLGAVLSCLRQAGAKGGDLKLCCMTSQVRAAFELVRMHRIFDIFETRDEAVSAFKNETER